ncbi:MAG TPA: mandelate racemase/muconate lactonizing enzyme family protein [Bryobacteraceae bacterium]|nr:mandelate racemase/muconate lactonizing enzyme family protein [Bryobacteraceae bacterium]
MKEIRRRSLLTGALALGATAAVADTTTASKKAAKALPKVEDLDRAAAAPVLKTESLKSPVIIESLRLLKKDNDYLVHVRSKDGAEGISFTNPPRAKYLDHIFQQLIAPFFIGKDARDLDSLLRELYRWNSNYKMYGLGLWSSQAWAEFAILDMLGRIANKPMGALLGNIVRTEVPYYVASGRRDTTPEQEIDYLRSLLEKSGAKALKFRVGGRMSNNADAMPDRTERLIPLVRKTFGDSMDIHADANSSYDVPEAIRVGHLLEDIHVVHYEEPCEFDHFEDIKTVTHALKIPVACGEQEFSEYRFRWTIANHGADIVQPDLFYYGGMVRSTKVARMADVAGLPIALHLSGGFGFVYMLHFASFTPNLAKYQEYKLGMEKYGQYFEPAIRVKDGKMSIPTAPGVGIRDIASLLKGAVPVPA